jgi:Amt family ammonium transporter
MGGLDFAGGTPVHISSGAAALAYSVMLGKRAGYSDVHGLPYRPHNVTHIVLGTVFLWVGWFGFNGGSALSANMRAVMACVVTHTAGKSFLKRDLKRGAVLGARCLFCCSIT